MATRQQAARPAGAGGGQAMRRAGWRIGLVLLALVIGTPAQAAINDLRFSNSYDGTPEWDPQAGPGFDTGPDDRVVRTNDRFEYLATFSTDGGGDDNVTLVSTLPKGNVAPRNGENVARWTNVPALCQGPGSGISDDGQTLTCNLGTVSDSGTQSVYLNATVLGSTPNGTALPAPSLEMTSSATTTPLPPRTQPEALQVSAAPFYDVVVQMSYAGDPRAYGYRDKNGPGNEDGFFHRPMVGLVAKHPNGHGSKGVEQLDPGAPVSFEMNVSGYPNGVLLDNWHDGSDPAGTPAATGGFVNGCGSAGTTNNTPTQPSSESGGAVNTYQRVLDVGPSSSNGISTVPNGGSCDNPAQSGTNITFDVNGMDTTQTRRPTRMSGGPDIPERDGSWVSNKSLVLWTPSTEYPPNQDVSHTISLGSVTGRSISGQALTGDDTSNNSTQYNIRVRSIGSASKRYTSDNTLPSPRQTQCDPEISNDCHVNYMAPTQTVRSRVILSNNSTGSATHTDAYVCEIIDRTAYDIGDNFRAVYRRENDSDSPAPTIRYGAKAGGPYFASTDSAPNPRDEGPSGTSEYASARCNDDSIQWFDTAAEAEAAGGLVYVRVDGGDLVAGARLRLETWGLILRDTWAANISVLSPSDAAPRVAGERIPEDTIIRNDGDVGSSYYPNGTQLRDNLQVVRIRTVSRVTKKVIDPANAENTAQPAGTVVTYQLQPRFSTQFPPEPLTYTVTDVLPPGLEYQDGSATVGGTAQEPTVRQNDPADGYTTLVWTFPDVEPFVGADGAAANRPPIEFKAMIALSADDGDTLRNSVFTSGSNDEGTTDYAADCIYNTDTQNYGNCRKAAGANVSVQTPPGFQLRKQVLDQTIEPGQDFRYRVQYISFGSDIEPPDIPHFIDILPFIGDGNSNSANNFSGRSPASRFEADAYALEEITVPSNDSGMQVYYTNRPPTEIHNDPRDPSNNIPNGATRWCLESELGSAGCPATIGDSTGVRFAPSVDRLPAGEVYNIDMRLSTDVAIAKGGDIFANSVGGRSPNSDSELLYVNAHARPGVRVQTSSIAGRVFEDEDDNGVPEDGDEGIGGVEITLHGCVPGPDGTLDTTSIPETGDPTCAGDDVLVTRTITTNADGTYRFEDLVSGLYRITEAQPSGYNDGKRRVGSEGGDANDQGTVPSVITNIPLSRATEAVNYDFAELPIPSEVSVAKTSDPASDTAVINGQTLTYTVTVTVAEAATTGVVTLTDTLSTGLELVPDSYTTPANGQCSADGQEVTCTLPAGAEVGEHEFKYQARVTAAARGSVNNSVVPSGPDEPTCAADACSTEHPVTPAEVVVSKTSNPAEDTAVAPGTTITYTVAVTVVDAPTSGVVTLADTLSAGLTLVPDSYTVPTGGTCDASGQEVTCQLAANSAIGTHEFSYEVTVADDATGTVDNVVVPSGDDEPVCATAEDCATQHPIAPPVVSVVKSSDPASGSSVMTGQTLTYTVRVNVADAKTTDVVTLTDTLSEGLSLVEGSFTLPPQDPEAECSASGQVVTCTMPAGAALGDHDFQYQVRVDPDAEGTVSNSVVPTGADEPTCPAETDGICRTEHPVTPAAVTVTKTSDPAEDSPVVPGETVTYTVAVTVADAPTSGVVTLNDTLGVGQTLVADSFVEPTGGDCSASGQEVTCTLAAGAAIGVHEFEYEVMVDADASGSIGNVVKPSGPDEPICPTEQDCRTTHPLQPSSVAVTKTSDPVEGTAVEYGQVITYTVAVTVSDAPTKAVVTLTDHFESRLTLVPDSFEMPAGARCEPTSEGVTCELPAGAAVGVHEFTYQATVQERKDQADEAEDEDEMQIACNPGDPGCSQGDAVTNVVVPSGADNPTCLTTEDCQTEHPLATGPVTVFKSSDPDDGTAVLPGQTITYTVAVTVSDAPTDDVVTLTDTFGEGLTLVADSFETPTGASCEPTEQGATCRLPGGAQPGVYEFKYQVTVDEDATDFVNNTVVPSGGDQPSCEGEDRCRTAHPIAAILTLDKSLSGDVQPAAGTADEFIVTYAVTAANIGGSKGTYTLIDTPRFDPDATVVSATVQRGDEAQQTLTGGGPWTLATDRELAADASEVYTVAVRLRVQAGSDQTNDTCTDEAGNGLYNDAQLTYGEETLDDNACADTPVPSTQTQLVIEKNSPVREAEVGDTAVYTVRIRNNGPGIALRPVLVDRMPAGFRLVGKTVRVRGANLVTLAGEPAPVLRMTLDRIDPGQEATVQYRARLGVGSQQGDGINRAHMECSVNGAALETCSNEARWKIVARGGVFSEEGCVVGQIYVDANGNFLKDREELGIPGVRLYFQDGTYLISDVEGKYSFCGLRPVTHVLKVDSRTLPRGSRLVTSSSRNAGDANSLFIDLKNGEMQRADFIEGSASNLVLEQVKARRAAGEVRSVETEAGQPGLKFESKPAPQGNPPQQGTDSANQPIERTRQGDGQAADGQASQPPESQPQQLQQPEPSQQLPPPQPPSESSP